MSREGPEIAVKTAFSNDNIRKKQFYNRPTEIKGAPSVPLEILPYADHSNGGSQSILNFFSKAGLIPFALTHSPYMRPLGLMVLLRVFEL